MQGFFDICIMYEQGEKGFACGCEGARFFGFVVNYEKAKAVEGGGDERMAGKS
jgi:hypothetical protein